MIENFLGTRPNPTDISRLRLAEVDELGGLLAELSESQSFEPMVGDSYHVGGWLAANWSEPRLRQELSNSLLYYPSLLVLDPLADFFDDKQGIPLSKPIRHRRPDGQFNVATSGPELWAEAGSYAALRKDPEIALRRLESIIRNLYDLEVPIRSGAVVLRNQWSVIRKRRSAIETSVRADVHSEAMREFVLKSEASGASFQVWDNLRGFRVSLDGAVPDADKPWELQHVAFFLAKTLAVAEASGATYVPTMAEDLELLRTKARTATREAHPAEFLSEVSRLVVPSLDIPIREASTMRASSQAFDDWRRELSALRRTVSGLSGDELRESISDALVPRMHAVERELANSRLVPQAERELAEIIFTAVGAAGVAAAMGMNPVTAVGASTGAGVVQWLRKAYFGANSKGVLGLLMKTAGRAPDNPKR